MKLTEKQRKFCDLYLKLDNATEAARQAGYSAKYTNTNVSKLLQNTTIKNYIDKQLEKLRSARIADVTEIMEHISSSMRGEIKEEVVVTEGTGDGTSEARIIKKQIRAKDRLKAAELLGKRYGLFTEKLNVSEAIPVVIVGEDDLDE